MHPNARFGVIARAEGATAGGLPCGAVAIALGKRCRPRASGGRRRGGAWRGSAEGAAVALEKEMGCLTAGARAGTERRLEERRRRARSN